jgi:outer membrane lipoprotein-sorting protein
MTRLALCASLAACLMAGPALAAKPPKAATTAATLPPALVEKLRQIRALTADFREEKKMAILVTPIVRTGTLAYEAPGRLAQQVATPAPARLVLDGKVLSMSEGQGKPTTRLDIEAQPAVGLLVRLLLGVLAGDVATLGQHTKLSYRDLGKDAWSIDLLPKDPLLEKLIKSMHVSGRGAIIDVLRVVDRSGDETTTRFSNAKLLPGFTADERARRFGP